MGAADTKKVTVEIPATLADEFASAGDQLLADLLRRGLRDYRIEQALAAYRRGGMSFAAAAEMAAVGQSELARAAYVRGMSAPYDEDGVAEELA